MRRGLTLLSLGLVAVGLELSTETISTAFARLAAGTRALATGSEYFVSAEAFATGLAMLSVGLVLWALLMWSGRERLQIEAVGRRCPECGEETLRMRRKLGQRVLSRLVQEPLTRRRCEVCGWAGLALKK